GHVVAPHPEMAQGDRDVRFRSAEAGVQLGRLEQALLARRAEPQQQLAERDHPHARAALTCVTSSRARAVSSAALSWPSSAARTSAPPTLTAAAPARIQSP